MGKYEPVFWIILIYILTPLFLTRWYAKFRKPGVFAINFLFAIACVIGFYYLYNRGLSNIEKGAVVVLWAPIIFLMIFKIADRSVRANYKRHFILANRYTQLDHERPRAMDIFFSLMLYILPFGLPFFLRAMGVF